MAVNLYFPVDGESMEEIIQLLLIVTMHSPNHRDLLTPTMVLPSRSESTRRRQVELSPCELTQTQRRQHLNPVIAEERAPFSTSISGRKLREFSLQCWAADIRTKPTTYCSSSDVPEGMDAKLPEPTRALSTMRFASICFNALAQVGYVRLQELIRTKKKVDRQV